MPPKGTLGERLVNIEQQIQAAQAVAAQLDGRDPRQETPRVVRLAKTTSSSTYPTTGQKFEIIFTGATYTEAIGVETPTLIERSASPQAWVFSLSGAYIAEGELIWVFEFDGQWWTWQNGGLLGKIASGETLVAGGSAFVDIWTGTAGSETASGLSVSANDWMLTSGQTIAAGKKVILDFINGAFYVIAAECA